ncbi:hypothetical protein JOL79_11270 [Microbispora sp. RL4-1S]|uniref:Uncharacterized protein n=1 Tax=Microbispora oryzae TaxID=2806554 RepID=A0A940WGK1_9ACTN|nr:hypothetical protein [Microbispora oryzae]MBP2704393.1 hypothetical protein [Microbispora oryzae]
MADRTVTVKLRLDNKSFIAGLAQAEAAAKRFRDSLEGLSDPFKGLPKEWPLPKMPKELPLPKVPKDRPTKDGDETAGAFARSFSRRLETAFRALPKAQVNADSTDAQIKVQKLRGALQELSTKTVGVDIDAATALTELQAIKSELETVDTSSDIDLRIDTSAALGEITALQAEVDRFTTDQAQRQLDQLRARMDSLSGRTIGVDLDAGAAKAELADIQRQLESLNRTNVNPRLQVDSARALADLRTLQDELNRLNADQAQRQLDDLRARLDTLRGRTIGVDLDAGAAKAELSEIQRALEALNRSNANPQIRIDSARALADVRTMQAELAQVGSRTARPRVDADVSGALRNIGLVAAALASLPAATTVGVAAAAFGAAGAGAAGFAAVAVPALGRVNEALKQQESSAGGAGGAAESLASKQARAAQQALSLAEASDRVRDAQDAVRQAQQQVADAVEQAASRQESAARRIEDAERGVADSHRATQRAVEDLTRAREEAQQKLEDLALATEGGALAEERARISLARAQSDLAKANVNPATSQIDKQDAALRVREAEFALKSVQARNAQLAKEQADANAKGVEGSDQVRAAKDNVASATQREQDAERDLRDARVEAAKTAVEGQRSIAEAQAAVIKAQRDAQRAAQRLKVEQLQAKAAMQQTGGAAGGAASKMSELSKAEQGLAKDIKAYQDASVAWQRSLEGDVFPAISGGLALVQSQLPRISPLVRTAGRSFLDLEKDAGRALKAPFWGEFLFDLNTAMPRAIEGFGHTAGNIVTGVAGFFDALLPHTGAVVDSIEDASKSFADWGKGLRGNNEFQAFVDYVSTNGPKVLGIVEDLGATVSHILQAGAGAGSSTLDVIAGIADQLAHLSPEQVQAVALGVTAVVGAARAGTALKLGGWLLLAELLGKMSPGQIQAVAVAISGVIVAVKGYQAVTGVAEWWGGLSGGIGKAGNAAGTATGKFSRLKDVLAGGGFAAGAGAIAVALGNIDRELSGLNPDVATLTKHLDAFTKGGAPAQDVLDQLAGSTSVLRDIPGVPVLNDLSDLGEVIRQMGSDGALDQAQTKLGAFLNTLGGPVGVTLDHGAERLANVDKALAGLVQSGNASGAASLFDGLTKQARDAGIPLEKLQGLFPLYSSAASAAVGPTNDIAGAVDIATQRMDAWTKSVDTFSGRTDAARATQEMSSAFRDAQKAIADANGQLDINAAKTDAQRDAIIRARDQFIGYLQKVREGADAQKDLSGRTFDATKSVLEQLPHMTKLAGSNKEARDQVLLLAQAYGISRDDAIKAAKGGQQLLDVLKKLKPVDVHVNLELNGAYGQLNKFLATIGASTPKVGVGVYKNAAGGVYAWQAGGVEAYAAGGSRSTPPMVAAQPTILFGEGKAKEYFIPTDPTYRGRAVEFLTQAASDLGMQVVVPASGTSAPRAVTKGGKTTATATTSSGSGSVGSAASTGGAGDVVVVNLDDVELAVGYTARLVTGAVTEAASTTAQAADQLGDTVDSSVSGLQTSITTLTSSITSLASSVDGLSAAVTSAGSAAAAGGGKTSTSSSSSKASSSSSSSSVSRIVVAAVANALGGVAKAALTSGKATASGSLGQVSGSQSKPVVITNLQTYADGGLATGPVLAGEDGWEVIVPVSAARRDRGRETLHQAARMLGENLSPARAAPRYSPASGGAQLTVAIDESFVRRLEAAVAKARGVNFTITNHNPVAESTSTSINRAGQYVSNLGV